LKKSSKAVLISTLFFVFLLVNFSCKREVAENNNEEIKSIPVEVTEVSRANLRKVISLTGNIEPWKVVNVVPDIGGKIAKIYVKEGDRVKKGQLLAELDTEAARLQLAQAKAALEMAQASFKDAKRNMERMERLRQEKAVSEQQYEKMRLAYDVALAQLNQAQKALDLVQHQIKVSLMKAPFSGVITGKYINEGETINPMMPGGRGVITLMDISRVKCKVNITERNLKEVRVGQKVLLTVDSYPGHIFIGKVYVINHAADPLTRSFEVQVAVPNPDLQLKPGMFARIKIVVEERENVISIPVDAVLEEGSNYYVYVVENQKAIKRKVKLGLEERELIEVQDGLRVGEKIVVVGKEMLKDEAAVRLEGGEVK